MKAVDHWGQPRRKQKIVRRGKPVNDTFYRLRDPKNGQFLWDSSKAGFNPQGRQWGSKKAALNNWARYTFEGLKEGENRPELELVMFKVEVSETGKTPDVSPDMSRSAAFAVVVREHHSAATFAKKLDFEEFAFTHIVMLEADAMEKINPLPGNLVVRSEFHETRSSYGMPRGPEYYGEVALQSVKDMLYIKMALHDYIVAIFSVDEIIAQSKVALKEARAKKLKKEATYDEW